MFRAARLKLTAWYIGILLAVSVTFSLIIYAGVNRELERFAQMQRFRIERRYFGNSGIVGDIIIPPSPLADPELLADTRRRIITILVLINLGIAVIAGGLGYMLSGKTLEPIQTILNDQQRFISDASHELRTPLAALKSSMEVNLRDPKLDIKEARLHMQAQLDQVNQLHQLSDNLLHMLALQSPHKAARFSKVDLSNITDTVLKKVQPLLDEKSISLINKDQPVHLEADRDSLERLLIILIDNAVKYSPPQSQIHLIVTKRNRHAILKVSDQGIGISPKDLPHVFDRFYRADQAREHRQGNGFGLGLAIAKEIVTAHHGNITARSTKKQGTTFTVSLPLKQPV